MCKVVFVLDWRLLVMVSSLCVLFSKKEVWWYISLFCGESWILCLIFLNNDILMVFLSFWIVWWMFDWFLWILVVVWLKLFVLMMVLNICYCFNVDFSI